MNITSYITTLYSNLSCISNSNNTVHQLSSIYPLNLLRIMVSKSVSNLRCSSCFFPYLFFAYSRTSDSSTVKSIQMSNGLPESKSSLSKLDTGNGELFSDGSIRKWSNPQTILFGPTTKIHSEQISK